MFTKRLKFYIIALFLPLILKAEEIPSPIKAKTFAELIEDITVIILDVGIPLAAIMLIYSGFLFVTAGGNEEKLKKAKQNFYWAIIGAAVIIGARVIAKAVVDFAQGL